MEGSGAWEANRRLSLLPFRLLTDPSQRVQCEICLVIVQYNHRACFYRAVMGLSGCKVQKKSRYSCDIMLTDAF